MKYMYTLLILTTVFSVTGPALFAMENVDPKKKQLPKPKRLHDDIDDSGREESLRGVFTRNYPHLAALLDAANQSPERREALIREARALDPRFRELYVRQYPTANPEVPTPVRDVEKSARKRKKYHDSQEELPLSQPEMLEIREEYLPQEGWSAQVQAPGGYEIFQRDELIDPWRPDERGRLNIERMLAGQAPIGPDLLPVNLHHALRQDPGPLEELSGSVHRTESGLVHFPAPGIGDRTGFDEFRRLYWQARAYDFLESLGLTP